jgi:hypothetical protein
MGLGYMLLAVKSEQDNYLIGNPQFTFFKSVYKKHTNFALDNIFLNFVGDNASNNYLGRKIYLDIPKNGDLVHRMYLYIDFKRSDPSGILTDLSVLAYSFIEYIEIFIGGQSIDKLTGEWLQLWHELNQDKRKELALANMVSNHNGTNANSLYIPLRFWFNNDIGLALPLIALQYNDVRIEVKFNSVDTVQTYSKDLSGNTVDSQAITINKIQMLTEYIHLDTEERRLFVSNPHEYLITQLQTSLQNSIPLYLNEADATYQRNNIKIDLRFNHPVKELLWTVQDSHAILLSSDASVVGKWAPLGIFQYNYWRNYTPGQDQLISAILVLNGKDMTEEIPSGFYRNVQQYQYHNGYGMNYINNFSAISPTTPQLLSTDLTKGSGVYSYSFALKPDEFQPSGSLNFSQLENSQLKFKIYRDVDNFTNGGITNINSKIMNIYAINYNVLRINSGMAGLAFIS